MNKPHKHADLIKAWADGAKIQHRPANQARNWEEARHPIWITSWEYRIKPEPKPDYSKYTQLMRLTYNNTTIHHINGVWDTQEHMHPALEHWEDYTVINKLELVFDGETNKIKKVNIL